MKLCFLNLAPYKAGMAADRHLLPWQLCDSDQTTELVLTESRFPHPILDTTANPAWLSWGLVLLRPRGKSLCQPHLDLNSSPFLSAHTKNVSSIHCSIFTMLPQFLLATRPSPSTSSLELLLHTQNAAPHPWRLFQAP